MKKQGGKEEEKSQKSEVGFGSGAVSEFSQPSSPGMSHLVMTGADLQPSNTGLSEILRPAIEGPEGPIESASRPSPPEAPKRVEVVCEGRLGPNLYKKGDVTSDPDIVALLDNPKKRHLVRLR